MEYLRDWIVPLLDRSQSEYHSAGPENSISNEFSISNELSGVRLSPNFIFDENVQLVEVRSRNGDIKGTVTDVQHSIRAIIPRNAINESKRFADAANKFSRLQSGTIIRVLEIEVRVSNCFDPPQTALYIHSFQVLAQALSLDWYSNNLQICAEGRSSFGHHTSHFAAMKNLREGSIRGSSPRSPEFSLPYKCLRPIDDSSDSESQDGLASQARFATKYQTSSRQKPMLEQLQALGYSDEVLESLESENREKPRREQSRSNVLGTSSRVVRGIPAPMQQLFAPYQRDRSEQARLNTLSMTVPAQGTGRGDVSLQQEQSLSLGSDRAAEMSPVSVRRLGTATARTERTGRTPNELKRSRESVTNPVNRPPKRPRMHDPDRPLPGVTSPVSRPPKKPRMHDPDRPLPGVTDDAEMSLNDVPTEMKQKTTHLNSMLVDQTVRSCYEALILADGDLEKANRYLMGDQLESLTSNSGPSHVECLKSAYLDEPPSVQPESPGDMRSGQELAKKPHDGPLVQKESTHREKEDELEITTASETTPILTNEKAVTPTSRFQRWRAEAIHGRYIPRYAVKIAKDQLCLLESSQSWQPPLVGESVSKGTLPLTLLNKLTEAVDGLREREQAGTASFELSQPTIVMEDQEFDQEIQHSGAPTQQNIPQKADDSPRSTIEVIASQWPPSPPSPRRDRKLMASDKDASSEGDQSQGSLSPPTPLLRRRQLPPDSSPPLGILEQVQANVKSLAYEDSDDNSDIHESGIVMNANHRIRIGNDQSQFEGRGDDLRSDKAGVVIDPHEHENDESHNDAIEKDATEVYNATKPMPETPLSGFEGQAKMYEHAEAGEDTTPRELESKVNRSEHGANELETRLDEAAHHIDVQTLTSNDDRQEGHQPGNTHGSLHEAELPPSPVEPMEAIDQTQTSSTSTVGRVLTASQKIVQVKRTPFLPRKSPIACGQHHFRRTVTHSSPTSVPGTFNDRSIIKTGGHKHQLQQRPSVGISVDPEVESVSEMNVSEDDRPGADVQNGATVELMNAIHEIKMEFKAETEVGDPARQLQEMPNQLSTANETPASVHCKRDRDSHDADRPSGKRTKPMAPVRPEHKQEHGLRGPLVRAPDSDYFAIQEKLREERREFFSDSRPRSTELNPASSTTKLDFAGLSAGPESDKILDSDRSSVNTNRISVSTPLTNPSIHRRFSGKANQIPVVRSTSENSQLSQSVVGVLSLFKTTYPSYDGDVVKFRTACELISSLKKDSMAPHPSLWDDFVIRLRQDYQEYVRGVMEVCGSPLPYKDYYDQLVEPQILKGVIRPDFINAFIDESWTPSRVANPAMRVADVRSFEHKLDRSVEADTSVSNFHPRPTSISQIAVPATQVERDGNEACYEEVDLYQQRSVKLWLEKAAGAESPVLGTPDFSKELGEIPFIDLDKSSSCSDDPIAVLDAPALAQQGAVPMKQPAPSQRKARLFRLERTQREKQTPAPKRVLPWLNREPPAPDLKQSVPRRDALPPKRGVPSLNKDLTASKQMVRASKDCINRVSQSAVTSTVEREPLRSEDFEKPYSIFQTFSKNYSSLPSEKELGSCKAEPDCQHLIDIFKWRR